MRGRYLCEIQGGGDTAPKSTTEINHIPVKIQLSFRIIWKPSIPILQQDEEEPHPDVRLKPQLLGGGLLLLCILLRVPTMQHPSMCSYVPIFMGMWEFRLVRIPLSNQNRYSYFRSP